MGDKLEPRREFIEKYALGNWDFVVGHDVLVWDITLVKDPWLRVPMGDKVVSHREFIEKNVFGSQRFRRLR